MLIDSITKKLIFDAYEKLRSPFYLFDEQILKKQWELLCSTLPPRTRVHYAVMANDEPRTLAWFNERGSRVFVGSWEHLKKVESIGFSTDRIVSGITNLTPLQIEDLLQRVGTIILSSEAELEFASTLPSSIQLLIRVNVAEPKKKFRGGVRTMGVCPELVTDRWGAWTSRDPRLVGIHSYAGTNVHDLRVLARRARQAIRLSSNLANIKIVDLGGGFPSPSNREVSRHELTAFWKIAATGIPRGTELWVEPGRFLVGPTSLFIAAVTSIEFELGQVIIGTDASVFMFPRRILFGASDQDHPIQILKCALSDGDQYWENTLVTGNTTFSRDVLYKGPMSQAQVGDLLVFGNAGAYCRAAIPRFLGTAIPSEVRITDKHESDEIPLFQNMQREFATTQIFGYASNANFREA